MPSSSRFPVPEVLPAVMRQLAVVPEFLPAPPPALVLPERLPADLPSAGRAALAAALAGELPGRKRPDMGELVRGSGPCRWDDAESARLRGFLRTVADLRARQGRSYPLDYLIALPLIAGMGGDRPGGTAAEAGRAPGQAGGAATAGRDHDRPRSRAGLRPGRIRPGAVLLDGRPGSQPAAGNAPPPADRRQGG